MKTAPGSPARPTVADAAPLLTDPDAPPPGDSSKPRYPGVAKTNTPVPCRLRLPFAELPPMLISPPVPPEPPDPAGPNTLPVPGPPVWPPRPPDVDINAPKLEFPPVPPFAPAAPAAPAAPTTMDAPLKPEVSRFRPNN